jgi:hypothetical protein
LPPLRETNREAKGRDAEMVISTRQLGGLPSIEGFRRLVRALAMLDAILSPEWQLRYYSFNSRWAKGEMMASMRNGSGNHWFALLCSDGIALHGLAHDAPMFRPGQPWPGIFEDLPVEFHDNFLREPAFMTEHSTFCIWRRSIDDHWSRGSIEFPALHDPDGSEGLLSILSGDVEHYLAFARDYYEVDVEPADVAAVYHHHPLTEALIRRLNPNVGLATLVDDMGKIGYPQG